MVVCIPDWGNTGEHAHWRRLFDRMTVGRAELPDRPIYIHEDSQETMPAPDLGSSPSIVDGSLNPVPPSDLNQVVLKELMVENRGSTLQYLKKRSEYSSVTTTSGECSDEQVTPAVSTPLPAADDHLSESASAIPPVNPDVLTLNDSAFLGQLLMDEVNTLFSQSGPLMDLPVRYLALNPHPITCPSRGTTYKTFSRFYGLMLRVSSDGPA